MEMMKLRLVVCNLNTFGLWLDIKRKKKLNEYVVSALSAVTTVVFNVSWRSAAERLIIYYSRPQLTMLWLRLVAFVFLVQYPNISLARWRLSSTTRFNSESSCVSTNFSCQTRCGPKKFAKKNRPSVKRIWLFFFSYFSLYFKLCKFLSYNKVGDYLG